ncbi:MAG: acyl-CoA thioesterase [Flavobacteriaceae bacterium]
MEYHGISFRIRYGETDQMGVVYHGNFPQYLEVGRVEWLRNIGVSYKEMEEGGIMLPVTSLAIEYKKPARYDDTITVRTRLKKLPAVRIEFEYEILNQEGEVLALAHTVLVFMDAQRKRPIKCPADLLEKIKGHYMK